MSDRSGIPRSKWTPFRVLFDRWLIQAHHKRTMKAHHEFLKDVGERFERKEISETRMREMVAERLRKSKRPECTKVRTGNSTFYDEGIIFEDMCDRYRTWITWYKRNCSVEIVICSRSTRGKKEKLWMNATYVIEFTNDISTRNFYISFRGKRQRCRCDEKSDCKNSCCFLDVAVRHESDNKTCTTKLLGSGWGTEPGELFENLAGTRFVMSSESDRVDARRKIVLLKQRTREHEPRRALIENSARRIQGVWQHFSRVRKARAALKVRKRNRRKRLKRLKKREKERMKNRESASRVLQRFWRRCVPQVRTLRRCVRALQNRWRAKRKIRCFFSARVARIRFLRFRSALRCIQSTYRRKRRLFLLKKSKENMKKNHNVVATSPRGRCFHVVPTQISLAMVMPPEARLTNEINEFALSMQRLVKLMYSSHRQTMSEIRRVIQSIFPCAMIKLYGSCATKLALPSSDLDLVVMHRHQDNKPCSSISQRHAKTIAASCLLDTPNPADQLHLIRRALIHEPWASGIKLVGMTMPLLKLSVSPFEMLSSFQGSSVADHKIDISSGCARGHSGIHAATWINKQVELRPILRPLLLVLKQYTRESGVADTWTGGIGSFTLSLLLIRLLQHNEQHQHLRHFNKNGTSLMGKSSSQSRKTEGNESLLLLQFLRFYGYEFDCQRTGICVSGDGAFFPLRDNVTARGGESSLPSSPYSPSRTLIVLSPLTSQVDLGVTNVAAGVYRFSDVQRAFARGYDTLVRSFKSYIDGKTISPLRSLLRVQWGAGGQRKVLLEKMKRSLMKKMKNRTTTTTTTTTTSTSSKK